MPRAKSTSGTKSSAIREALAANPKAKASEIVALLAKSGTKVTPGLVYALKAHGKAKAKKAKRQAAVATAVRTGSSNPVELVTRTRQLAMDLGGLKNLRAMVDALD